MHEVRWINIVKPTVKDIERIRGNFNFHDLILEELLRPSARATVEAYDDYLYMVYYFPVYDPAEQTSRRAEMDFLITPREVITVSYQKLDALNNIDIENAKTTLDIVHAIVSAFLGFQERQLRHIREKVESVGLSLFKNREREVLEKISRLKRDISEYRVITRYQKPILESLLKEGANFWDEDSEVFLNDLRGGHIRVVEEVENFREAISDFEDTNNQLMNLKINNVMKTFTILSFLTFPFVLVATVFGMNLSGNPFFEISHGFWVLLGVIVVGIASMALYFKSRKWL